MTKSISRCNDTLDMFPVEQPLPKKRVRRFLMHVLDAGDDGMNQVIQFRCRRCGHDTGWIIDKKTVTENKRGLPCPVCNKSKLVKTNQP